MKYGLGFTDDTAVNVRNDRETALGNGIAKDALATETAGDQWDAIKNTAPTTDTGLAPQTDDVSTRGYPNENYVPYVPAWTSTDSGQGDSTTYGSGRDSWDKWDGCTPIAASMLIASHENAPRPEESHKRELMIDRLHRDMNTSWGGVTQRSDARDAINNYDYGNRRYTAFLGNARQSKVLNEVTSNCPILLGNTGGPYDDHMVTIVGYKNRANTLRVHDTWDWKPHNVSWGVWNSAGMITVRVS